MTPMDPRMTFVPLRIPPPNVPEPTLGLTSVLGDKRHPGAGRTLFSLPALRTGQGLLRGTG